MQRVVKFPPSSGNEVVIMGRDFTNDTELSMIWSIIDNITVYMAISVGRSGIMDSWHVPWNNVRSRTNVGPGETFKSLWI